MGSLMSWTIIPGTRVQPLLIIILVHEAILIVIPIGGHLGYYPSTKVIKIL
jgi:hypothetical protein